MSLFSKDEIGKGAEKSYMSGNFFGQMFLINFSFFLSVNSFSSALHVIARRVGGGGLFSKIL